MDLEITKITNLMKIMEHFLLPSTPFNSLFSRGHHKYFYCPETFNQTESILIDSCPVAVIGEKEVIEYCRCSEYVGRRWDLDIDRDYRMFLKIGIYLLCL